MNVLALLSDALLSTLRSVLRNDHRVVTAPRGGDLLGAVRTAAPDVLVLEPSAVPTAEWGTLTEFLARAGTPTVVVYTTTTQPAMRATVELARLGVRHIVLKGYDDTPRNFRALFDALATEFWISTLHARLAPHWALLPANVAEAVAYLFRVPSRVRDVAQLAEVAGVTPRTLHRQLRRAGLRSAKRLVLAARVEWAHALLRTGHLRVAEVSARLGYDSPRRFRRESQLLTGLPPAALRRTLAGDGLVTVLHARLVDASDEETPDGEAPDDLAVDASTSVVPGDPRSDAHDEVHDDGHDEPRAKGPDDVATRPRGDRRGDPHGHEPDAANGQPRLHGRGDARPDGPEDTARGAAP